MKHNIALISSILLVVPQAYLYANDAEPMNPPQGGGQFMQGGQQGMGQPQGGMGGMMGGQFQGGMMGGQQGMGGNPGMMGGQGGQQQPNGKYIEPTGGSKMLPPFGNQGAGPQDGGWKKPKGEMMNGSGGMSGSGQGQFMGNNGGMKGMKKSPMNGSGGQWTGSGAEAKMTQELKNRKRIVEELTQLGADTSVFTDEIINNPPEFWKLAETFRYLKQQSNSGKNMPNPEMGKWEDGFKNSGKTDEDMNQGGERKNTPTRPALSEKARKQLQDKLDKIPAEKRDATLAKLLANAESQLLKAKEKGNKANIRKLEAIVEIIQDEIDSGDDEGLINEMFN